MVGRKTWAALAIVIVASSVVAATALGEFESANKASTGSGRSIALGLLAGGAEVLCDQSSETAKSSWTIEQSGKATTKASSLLARIENPGECTAESSELTSTTAKLSSCELEVKQPHTEVEVSGRLVNTCTITASACEIILEAKANESIRYTAAAPSGSENELLLVPEIGNIVTTTKGTCPGIKGAKEGKLTGVVELDSVKTAWNQWQLTATVRFFKPGVTTGEITVTNGANNSRRIKRWEREMEPAGAWSATEEKKCETMLYAKNATCKFAITWNSVRGWARWSVWEEYPAFEPTHLWVSGH